MKPKKYKYMHTVNGKPGHYDGDQVCYFTVTRPIPLCDTLKQIRKEQAAAIKWRASKGFSIYATYGYAKVQAS